MEAVQEQMKPKAHAVTILVNEKEVTMPDRQATGRQIKQAAIAQGVQIDLGFVLTEELGHHKTRIVGDEDVVQLHEHARFVAVAPDDNS